MIERNGIKLHSLITKTDPLADEVCGRETCRVCVQEDPKTTNCRKSNITYWTSYRLCLKQGTRSIYVEESSRSLGERYGEHTTDCDKGMEGSHMAVHIMEEHRDHWEEFVDNGGGAWRHFQVEIVGSWALT